MLIETWYHYEILWANVLSLSAIGVRMFFLGIISVCAFWQALFSSQLLGVNLKLSWSNVVQELLCTRWMQLHFWPKQIQGTNTMRQHHSVINTWTHMSLFSAVCFLRIDFLTFTLKGPASTAEISGGHECLDTFQASVSLSFETLPLSFKCYRGYQKWHDSYGYIRCTV